MRKWHKKYIYIILKAYFLSVSPSQPRCQAQTQEL
jgi:hypothetical protein